MADTAVRGRSGLAGKLYRWFFEDPSTERRSDLIWPQHLDPASLDGGSYAYVNLSAAESSMQSVAVRSAVDLLASLASELPIDVFSGKGTDRRERPTPSYLEDPAGDGSGLPDWLYQVMVSWLLRGNLYGDVLDTSRAGNPTQVALIHPDEVSGWVDSDGVVHWTINGRDVPASRFLHRRVNPVPGRVQGLSPVAFHATTIGMDLTAGQFGLQWFRDGAHPSGLLTNSEIDMSGPVAKQAKDRFLASMRGRREPAVFGKGWDYKQIQVSPEESQFLQSQGWSEAQCARIFGPGVAEVLGYETGGSLTYTNVESRSAHLLVYSLNKWIRRLERLLTSMLPSPQYVRIDRDALLQATTLERYRAHEIALRNRWKVVNEVREDEDLGPVEWGAEPNEAAPNPAQPASGDDEEDGS